MAWAFPGGKTEQHYGILFLMLRAKALEKFQQDFAPEKIVSDFESGILSSVKIHLPNVEQLGCYFYYTQCVYRKIQNLGLVTLYKNTQTFQRTVQKIFVLPFLPPNSVGQLYQTLRSDFDNRRLILLHPKVGDFFQYVENQWIQGTPVGFWNVFNREGNARTTNMCEGWNSNWKTSSKKTIATFGVW